MADDEAIPTQRHNLPSKLFQDEDAVKKLKAQFECFKVFQLPVVQIDAEDEQNADSPQLIAVSTGDIATLTLKCKGPGQKGDEELVLSGGMDEAISMKTGAVPHLSCNNEEADTRLILHCDDAIKDGYGCVVVC